MAPQASRTRPGQESSNLLLSSRLRTPRRSNSVATTTSARASPSHSSKLLKTVTTNGTFKAGKVDTSLKSYDRRDPFTAFNALIKVLASLPSRILVGGGGGCQFKVLTTDEHKLCMHLCNIVEPFLLSSPLLDANNANSSNALFKPRTLLVHQPTEILDRIVSFVEGREDLMSFGISCKRVGEIVFPRHWEYRVVRAKVSMSGVWKHLCERADLAANVRVVEVLDERSERKVLVPRVCRKAGAGTVGGKRNAAGLEEVVSATDTSEDSSSASGNENEDGDGGGVKKLAVHKRQEKYFVAALARLTGLVRLKWEGNHSPISVIDDGTVWSTIAERCGASLRTLEVADNMVFVPLLFADTSDEGRDKSKAVLANLRSASLRSTQFYYGASREPDMNRIAAILNQCPNLENLEITYKAPRPGPAASPTLVANEFLVFGRWSRLTSLTLTNLSCLNPIITTTVLPPAGSTPGTTLTIQQNPLQTFLSAHPTLEVLKLLDLGPASQFRRLRVPLERNTLPRLRELHATREIVNMVLKAECDEPRPLEIIKGFKLVGATGGNGRLGTSIHDLIASSNTNANLEFYKNLKRAGASVKRIEVEAWGDLDDIRMLAWCVPGLTWLDIGRKLRPGNSNTNMNGPSTGPGSVNGRGGVGQGPVTNMVEWAEALSGFEELATFHGVKFFYEISPNAVSGGGTANDVSTGSSSGNTVIVPVGTSNTNISMTDRSRIKKNDEIAGVLAWKCGKLRRVDHWEGAPGATGKVIILLRDADFGPGVEGKVRWDVRRVKQ